METILITGSNGMVAEALKKLLSNHFNLKFLTRNPTKDNEFLWDIENNFIEGKALENIEHIIHLAGVSIGEKRWSNKQKKQILDSRVKSAELLLNSIKKKNIHLKSYISASAVGYYGTITTNETFTENTPTGQDFLSNVCKKWEQSADAFKDISNRIIKLRFGVIISGQGGALQKMLIPSKYHMNTILGSGKQIIPWIDIDDLSSFISYCIKNRDINGVFNVVSPNPISNVEFTHTLTKVLHKKILLPPIPKWIIKTIFGEASALLLEGSKISAQKMIDSGFQFQYPQLENCLIKELNNLKTKPKDH